MITVFETGISHFQRISVTFKFQIVSTMNVLVMQDIEMTYKRKFLIVILL